MSMQDVIAQKTLARKRVHLEIHYEGNDLSKSDLEKLRRGGARYNTLRGNTYTRYVKTRDTSILRRVLAKGEPRTVILRFRYASYNSRDLVLRVRSVEYLLREYAKAERAKRQVCPDCGTRHREVSLHGARCPACDVKQRDLIEEYRRGKAAVAMVEELWPAIRPWIER